MTKETEFLVISHPDINKNGGSDLFKVIAESKEQVQKLLGDKMYLVVMPGDIPDYFELFNDEHVEISRLDPPADWLARIINSIKWRQEGKSYKFYEGQIDGKTFLREIWARLESEVASKFPFLKPLRSIDGSKSRDIIAISIDEPDEELLTYQVLE